MPAADRVLPGIEPDGPVLYAEDGWSWAWIFAAPLFCAAAALFEVVTDAPVHWLMLTACAVASALCHAVMIAATRVHGRVRLTPTSYTQGTEALDLADVAEVLPLREAGEPEASWETARTLGELRDIPRRRGSVGLQLGSGAEVRAWCRNPRALHAALTSAVGGAEAGRAADTAHDSSADTDTSADPDRV